MDTDCLGANESCSNCACVVQVCGNGFLEGDEICDDGNLDDDDGCSSTCEPESPLSPYPTLSGSCVDNRLPAINHDEVLPYRWQLQAVSNIDNAASDCSDIASGTYIPAGTMTCDFGVYRFGDGGEELIQTME